MCDMPEWESPVLEYDTASKAVFQPGNGKKCFPAKAVFAFLGDEVENYAHTHDGIQIDEFESATTVSYTHLTLPTIRLV